MSRFEGRSRFGTWLFRIAYNTFLNQTRKPRRLVPRARGALAYTETVRDRVDPALMEWAGAGIFNTRVFPLMPGKLHRIVVAYDVGEDANSDVAGTACKPSSQQ